MVAHQEAQRNGVQLEEMLDKPAEMAREYPVASMLVVFGVGLGVGVLLSQAASGMAAPQASPSWMNSATAEKLSRQIYDAVAGAIPESIARQFHA